MNASIEDILRICGAQAIQIALLQEKVALLSMSKGGEDRLTPLTDEEKDRLESMFQPDGGS